jgi:hypothetical protein
MKTPARIVVFTLLFALVLPLASVGALKDDVDIPEDLAGFYVLDATSGTLIDNGDETYTLTLHEVPQDIQSVINAPYLSTWRYESLSLVSDWAANPDGLEASAVLEFEGVTLWVTLTVPAYDDETGTMSFTARITSIYEADAKESETPETFDAVTLFICMDYDFATGLLAGFDARHSDTREREIPRPRPLGWPPPAPRGNYS